MACLFHGAAAPRRHHETYPHCRRALVWSRQRRRDGPDIGWRLAEFWRSLPRRTGRDRPAALPSLLAALLLPLSASASTRDHRWIALLPRATRDRCAAASSLGRPLPPGLVIVQCSRRV